MSDNKEVDSTVSGEQQLADLIQGGGGFDSTSYKETQRLSRSNQLHRWLDYAMGTTIYFFSSAMHFAQQSNGLTLMGMWAAGTYLYINGTLRDKEGPSRDIWQGESVACWLWMLSSFRAFKSHGVMRYCGYSSYMGLGVAGYYTARWMGVIVTGEESS